MWTQKALVELRKLRLYNSGSCFLNLNVSYHERHFDHMKIVTFAYQHKTRKQNISQSVSHNGTFRVHHINYLSTEVEIFESLRT